MIELFVGCRPQARLCLHGSAAVTRRNADARHQGHAMVADTIDPFAIQAQQYREKYEIPARDMKIGGRVGRLGFPAQSHACSLVGKSMVL